MLENQIYIIFDAGFHEITPESEFVRFLDDLMLLTRIGPGTWSGALSNDHLAQNRL